MTEPLTIRALIGSYRADGDSPYQKLRFHVRENYDSQLRRIDRDHGDVPISDIRARVLLGWHARWSVSGVSMAHSLMVMVRGLFGYGMVYLEDPDCERLCVTTRKMKFKQGKPRDQVLTARQVNAIRAKAHKMGFASIALQQAFQFECTLRQKDGIGEWVPRSEPGESDVTTVRWGKWLRGMRWSEIDANLILRHVTSKREKEIQVDLKLAPMVLAELKLAYPGCVVEKEFEHPITRERSVMIFPNREILPASGPIIINETTGWPYLSHQFRRRWRDVANAAGVPKDVQNRDSRAGAITEALDSGASMEDTRKAATHATAAMTSRYSRDTAKAIVKTMKQRAARRIAEAEPDEFADAAGR